ncbi:hypothetical protein PYW08_000536 [Mythimna loreyi]|uniref:Uncharacterized protein n=4 Tax=Mythimna loreyi TaxID=667449 RepID=A0ACC2R986_9NEOP|nr:hypothetical protein PYW08_001025 [Mythimna loreyi]KAJ8736620.1 hypothetical protein PYW08_007276 [Mythimna loreyi]KAJ8737940.1 hypothetical protein PYW08_000535 [Mythimna loreyi]KAJ8737941.1 hypothetical protein PYW08_000536 [Mythimna loreyi]
MTALGRAAKVDQQLCLAHGIQLGIIDVLYNKNKLTNERPEEEENSTESDSDNEDGGFNLTEDRCKPIPLLCYNDIIGKVRGVVRMFRKSPTKNDILSKYVKSDHNNKELKLILDCKTRWSSLADMITRFLSIKDSVSKALIDLKSDIQFSDAELQILTNLSESLTVVKATVEALCQRDANLITAMAAMKFMLTKLRQDSTSISNQLAIAIEARIKQRLTEFTGVLLYLHSPTTYYKDIANDVNNTILNALDNNQIRSAIVNIVNKYFPISTSNEESSSQVDTLVNVSLNIKEQLGQEIKRALKQHTLQTAGSNIGFGAEERLDLETQVKVEMALYDNGGSMGNHLLKVYKALKSIPPTSVECERAFSSAGLMCNKIRSSLSDDSLDALVFLRSYYQAKNNIK